MVSLATIIRAVLVVEVDLLGSKGKEGWIEGKSFLRVKTCFK